MSIPLTAHLLVLLLPVSPGVAPRGQETDPPPAAEPEATVPSAAEHAERVFAAWPGQRYDYKVAGKPVGTIEMTNEIVEEDGRRVLRMTDNFRIKLERGRFTGEFVTLAELDERLTLLEMRGNGMAGQELTPVDLRFEDGHARGLGRGEDVDLEFEGPLATEFSVARRIALLPFEEDGRWWVQTLDTARMEVGPRRLIEYVGPTTIEIHRSPMPVWEFRYADDHGINTYWFDEEHRLVRALMREHLEWVVSPRG